MMNTIVNGISRPMFGWLSDHIGREMVMFIAFSLEALGILALGWYGSNPWAFVVLSGVVFFAWGEVYSLFSATAGRHVRHQAHRQDLRVALLCQGSGRVARAVREHPDGGDRVVDQRALHDGGPGPRRGACGDPYPQADEAPLRASRRRAGPPPEVGLGGGVRRRPLTVRARRRYFLTSTSSNRVSPAIVAQRHSAPWPPSQNGTFGDVTS